jgi:hypothetical protein
MKSKQYLYHFVPKNMQGTTLYPLNQLKKKMPEAYEFHNAKYDWRPEVQETVVPGLGKWNDVIHLSPIDPAETIAALKDAEVWKGWKWRVFKIDPTTLDTSKLVIMSKSVHGKDGKELKSNFEKFSLDLLKKENHLSPWTLNYFKECKKNGVDPLIYAGSPHVLYGAPIETKGLEIVTY